MRSGGCLHRSYGNGPLMDSGPPQSIMTAYLSSTTRVEASSSALESLTKYTPWARA